MALDPVPDLPEVLVQETPDALNRLVGFVCWAAGIGLAGFAIFVWWVIFTKRSSVDPGLLVLLLVVCPLAALMLAAGARLTRAGHAERVLFGPAVWFAIAGTSFVIGLGLVYVAVTHEGFGLSVGAGLASALLMALFAYGAGTRALGVRRRHRA
jgi:hypothetical protein